MSNEIEVRSREGFETIAKYLPADFEELARQHKVLETSPFKVSYRVGPSAPYRTSSHPYHQQC